MSENIDPIEDELPEREVEVTVSLTISKTVTITTNNYTIVNSGDEKGSCYGDNVEYHNLEKDVEEQVTLPCHLAEFVDCMFEADLDLKAAGKCKYLRDALADCRNWSIDDFEVVL